MTSTIPQSLPADEVDDTLGRAVEPDLNITTIDWIGPSFYCGGCGADVIAPGAQQVRVTVENEGLAQANGVLQIFIDEGSGFSPAGSSQSIGLLPGGVSQHVFSFTANLGTGQQIRAHATIISDPDPSNNDLIQGFDVDEVNDGEVYSDTLPANGSRLPVSDTVVSVGVRNIANIEHEATPYILLTPIGGGPSLNFTGAPVTLPAGSIASPAPVELASLIINASSLFGDYTLSGSVFFNSTSPLFSDVESIVPRTVSFSPYRATLIAPSDRAVEPGSSTSLSFLIQNVGEAPDRYNITVTDDKGWSDNLSVPAQTPIVNASESTVIVVPVTVPLGTNRSLSDVITVEIMSEADNYTLTDSTAVMAGDLLLGTLNHSDWFVEIIPGTEETIQYILQNNGTSPAIFDLEAGFSQTAPGWSVSIHPSTTPYMTVGEEIIVNVVVLPPSLEHPFDPTTKLAEGNQLTLWTSVKPQGGGPNVQLTTLEVQQTIMVELLAEQTNFPIDLAELTAGPVTRFVDLDMELRHNLISGISTSVDIELFANSTDFTPSVPGNGASEIFRWNSSVTPNQTSMDLGESQPLIATILGPSDLLPLAGNITVDIIANLTLSGALSGVQAPESSLSLILEIPELKLASVESLLPTTVVPETPSTVPINITNTGNHQSDFTLDAEGPEGWIVSISPTTLSNLNCIVDEWPSVGNDNATTTLSVTAPPNTRADTVFDVIVSVLAPSGEILAQEPIPFLVQEVIGATLTPEYAVAVIPVNGNASIALEANNTGNSLQTFDILIEETLDDINLTMISNSQIDIEPGEVSIVQIEVTADQFARADVNHSAQVVLLHNGLELDRIDVFIEMMANHMIEFDHAIEYSVVPGMNLSIPVNVTNMGNLEEFVNFTTTPPDGWQASLTPLNMTIDAEGNEVLPLIIDVTIPPMSSEAGLEPGAVHSLIMQAINVSDSIQVGFSTVQFNVEPIFVLSSDDFPDVVELLPGESRTFEIEISNDGNQDVILDLDCELDSPSRWDVSECDANNLTLASGDVKTISFSVQGIASDHYNLEQSDLRLTFSPQDNHSGDALLATVLRITRMHVDPEICPEVCEINVTESEALIPVNWMHVQAVGQTADSRAIAYELALVNTTRHIDDTEYGGDVNWSFEIDYGNGFVPLNGGPFTLNSATPLQLNSMTIRADLPPTVNIPPGDGWTFVFNLTHPEEFTSSQVIVEMKVKAVADPSVVSITIDGGTEFIESESGTIIVTIANNGNAVTALGIIATLDCNSGITIQESPTQAIVVLQPFENRELEWKIQSDALNWWSSSSSVSCSVTIQSPDMAGDDESNDVKSVPIEIQSWSLPLLILIPIALGLVLLSSRLLRRASEDERALMLCAYSGTAVLGAATQFNLGSYANFALAATALLWVLFIASRSSAFEIPAILSDRQNHQRGNNSIIENHEEEMDRVLKQLAAKLAFAPLGFILVAIMMPNDISWSLANISSILLYAFAGGLGVIFVTLRTRNTWLTIFDSLAAMEIESQELLNQLGNPSADLRRITIGQRWGEAHDVSVEVDGNV
ncbi:MAG: hypothetical protein VX627_02235 [Candidatus Thermoplasmatota archaeon]|nr:hypothetical protein [Candidatus Thermoplasmatota archaeon]